MTQIHELLDKLFVQHHPLNPTDETLWREAVLENTEADKAEIIMTIAEIDRFLDGEQLAARVMTLLSVMGTAQVAQLLESLQKSETPRHVTMAARILNQGCPDIVAVDAVASLRLLEQAQSAGCPVAACILGVKYHNGSGVTQDTEKALALCQQAAVSELPPAQYMVAAIQFERKLVTRENFQTVVRYLQQSAAAGYAPAQNQLACIMLSGTDAERHAPMAKLLLQAAADQGFQIARDNLQHFNLEETPETETQH